MIALTGQSKGRGSDEGWVDMNGQITEIGYYHVQHIHYVVSCFCKICELVLTFSFAQGPKEEFSQSYRMLMRIYCCQQSSPVQLPLKQELKALYVTSTSTRCCTRAPPDQNKRACQATPTRNIRHIALPQATKLY